MDDLLTPAEAAKALGLSVAGLTMRARKGTVPVAPGYAPGRHRRYRADVIAGLAGQQAARNAQTELAFVAKMAGTSPGQVKGWALVVNDGTSKAAVITSMNPGECADMLAEVALIVISGSPS